MSIDEQAISGADEVEGHVVAKLTGEADDVEGHVVALLDDEDDVEGHVVR